MNAPTPTLQGKFVWFEHASHDTAKARAFYERLFGWHVETMTVGGRPYSMLLNGDQAVGGLVAAGPGERTRWISYLSVADVDARCRAAQAAGAQVTAAPADFPPVGRGAGLVDPTGAEFWLWKSAGGDRPDAEVPVGGWCWNELWTPDDTRALAFYEGVFGYTHDSFPMPEGGPYHVLKTDPKHNGRGGLTRSKLPGVPAQWLPYVRSADCDATVAKARQLGSPQVLLPPTDVPMAGRIAILVDPLGAAVALIDPKPPA